MHASNKRKNCNGNYRKRLTASFSVLGGCFHSFSSLFVVSFLLILSKRSLRLNHTDTFFKNTMIQEIAEGVTPEMRDA